MASIRLAGIGKQFGSTPVLTDLELEVRDHEFMVLVGPSGCGKSTALRLIAGLEDPSTGDVEIGGRRVNDVAPKDRDVAMVFQSYALYPHMTVRENIAFGLRIRDLPAAEIDARVAEAAQVLGLEALLGRLPKALSGGQRQRVALGRAIVRKPEVFLFDEPLSNLDAELRVQMRAELTRLQRRLATTTVYVTHDQVEAMTLGHRIAVLAPTGADARPNLQQVGTPLEIYDRPANAFVARFIGSPPMNVFPATLSADGSTLAAPGFAAPVPVAFRAAARARAGAVVQAGLRPEHLGAAAHEGWTAPIALEGRVEIAETIGSEVIVYARVGDERLIARVATRRVPELGEPITLAADAAMLHLFDVTTGARLAEA
jgi:multiple sugar transport system ATP-binding protein